MTSPTSSVVAIEKGSLRIDNFIFLLFQLEEKTLHIFKIVLNLKTHKTQILFVCILLGFFFVFLGGGVAFFVVQITLSYFRSSQIPRDCLEQI